MARVEPASAMRSSSLNSARDLIVEGDDSLKLAIVSWRTVGLVHGTLEHPRAHTHSKLV